MPTAINTLWQNKTFMLIRKVFEECIAFFQSTGIPKDLKVDLCKTIIYALFTDNDEAINFQQPHTDYPYMITGRSATEKKHLSWTAHMPVTSDGSWMTIWFGAGIRYTLHIPYGQTLLLHSDVIHGGGVPNIDCLTVSKQFR
jgi:hypothetical protein